MSDRSSFNIRSSVEPDAMSAIAAEAEFMVKNAAAPLVAGETVKAQMNRAARNLRYVPGDWRVKAAWYREAGCWGAATFRDLQERYTKWRERQEARANARSSDATAALRALYFRYAETNPELFREQMDAIEHVLQHSGDPIVGRRADGGSLVGEAD